MYIGSRALPCQYLI